MLTVLYSARNRSAVAVEGWVRNSTLYCYEPGAKQESLWWIPGTLAL